MKNSVFYGFYSQNDQAKGFQNIDFLDILA